MAKKKPHKHSAQITRRRSKNKSYIGYCHRDAHKGYMTVEAVSQHSCLDYDCKYFEPFTNHPFWNDDTYTTSTISRKHLGRLKETLRDTSKMHKIRYQLRLKQTKNEDK